MCVTEVGCSWGWTRLVTRDLRTSNSNSAKNVREHWAWAGIFQNGEATSGCNRGAAVEANTVGELQLKRMQLGSSS